MDRNPGFTEYVVARRPHLYRTALLLCGDAHRAEDVVQNALAKLYVAWPRAERAASVDSYVRRILVNSHIDETRRPWRRERPLPDDFDAPQPAQGESHEVLWAALGALPRRQRQVVVLRHFWGLSVEETAADLGISTGTVKSQAHDAIASLRTALASLSIGDL